MSNNHRPIRKTRYARKSHFVEDVTMCVLNDPLPPYHPGTPPPDPNEVMTKITRAHLIQFHYHFSKY